MANSKQAGDMFRVKLTEQQKADFKRLASMRRLTMGNYIALLIERELQEDQKALLRYAESQRVTVDELTKQGVL